MMMSIILIYFSWKYNGDWDKIYEALDEKEKVSLKDANFIEQKINSKEWRCITILDFEYPNALKECYKPPFTIWLKGDEKLLSKNMICLTGNQIDDKTFDYLKNFVKSSTENKILISPSFKGVDQEVDKINDKNPKVIVLANGFDKPYINSNVNDADLLISEYPPHANVSKNKLRARNRLIAAFADLLVLFSSKRNGGMENMVNNFLNQGKEINCFPGDGSDEDGNTEFIRQGANLITKI